MDPYTRSTFLMQRLLNHQLSSCGNYVSLLRIKCLSLITQTNTEYVMQTLLRVKVIGLKSKTHGPTLLTTMHNFPSALEENLERNQIYFGILPADKYKRI